MEITPSIRRVGSDHVAAYLVVTDEGITAVDAGLPGFWKALRRELAAIGATPADIRGVVLTHGDVDHLGYAERLRGEYQVPLYIHHADAERALTGKKPSTPAGTFKPLRAIRFACYVLANGAWRDDHVKEVVEVKDGDVLPLPGAPVIVAVPGHSPGSVAVHVPAVDALFVGDAVTTRHQLSGEERVQVGAFAEDQESARVALRRLAGIRASWVLPGHGTPWHATPEEIAATLRAAAH
ncbi:MBL fold metallo-hydrolase [Streptomyces radicis]|uniref:MBL fold metallo-hydrolase n=1 Tax=Streptomyces radicis TaxID=1750517 RepID=A0A3A9W9U9_9ACTN|nr:MBL fold metallo-hydrolase [Streptomyces radicis]RKN09412.1 MBL fold metallo-hydrolase [Streptomyces radicis]RKN22991.1 MBL fold metallo-hydrolase [Streptomyces radicis]